jgi:hypothetical protein
LVGAIASLPFYLQDHKADLEAAATKGLVRRADITRLQLDGLGTEPLVLQAELVINTTPLSLSASAGAADAPDGARWPFQVQGPTAAPLGQIAGINGLPAGPFRLDTGLRWDGQILQASAIDGSSEADVLPAPLIVSDGEISVPSDGTWSARLTGKLGDRPRTLQLTPVAVPKGNAQTPETKTVGALEIKATLADGRFDGELRPAADDGRALLSGTLNAGHVTLKAFTQG